MAPSTHELEPPAIPGRFKMATLKSRIYRQAWRMGCIVSALSAIFSPTPASRDLQQSRQDNSTEIEVTGSTGKLRFNQLQYIGTHNSYHIAPNVALVTLAKLTDYKESDAWPAAKLYQALDYTHPSLTIQLELGMRQFEIDIHYDPQGGKFAQPGALRALQASDVPTTFVFDPEGRMEQPGFKVFHGGTDVLSTCLTLKDCLGEIKSWSDANSRHLPIVIQIEAKVGAKPALANAYTPPDEPPFDLRAWASLESEISEVLGRDKVFTPADAQGDHSSLSKAIKGTGWPTLDEMAGHFVFLLLNKETETNSYHRALPNLTERLFFTSHTLDHRNAGWFRIPDPDYPDLRRVIRNGQLATVQADTHTIEAV